MMCTTSLIAGSIDHVEPPCWWIGMDTDLQLMIHGDKIAGSTVTSDATVKGITVGKAVVTTA